MNIEKIGGRNWMFRFDAGGWSQNLGLILGVRHAFVIDTGLGTQQAAEVKKYIPPELPVVVINTHYHWDHVWGNAAFEGADIAAHALCPGLLSEKWDEMLARHADSVRGEAPFCPPTVVFDSELSFPQDGVRLFYTPGHSADSISVLDERDRVLYAGDNVGDDEEDILPSVAVEEPVFLQTLQKYRETDFDLCVSGHNSVLQKSVFERIRSERMQRDR